MNRGARPWRGGCQVCKDFQDQLPADTQQELAKGKDAMSEQASEDLYDHGEEICYFIQRFTGQAPFDLLWSQILAPFIDSHPIASAKQSPERAKCSSLEQILAPPNTQTRPMGLPYAYIDPPNHHPN